MEIVAGGKNSKIFILLRRKLGIVINLGLYFKIKLTFGSIMLIF